GPHSTRKSLNGYAVASGYVSASVRKGSCTGPGSNSAILAQPNCTKAARLCFFYIARQASSGMSVAIIGAEDDYEVVIVSGANLQIAKEDVRESRDVIQHASVLVLENKILDARIFSLSNATRPNGSKRSLRSTS